MYKIAAQSIKTFVEDISIKLPRFQRKKTWKNEQNFLLAISVFKKYPIGVVILNEEQTPTGTVKYLLDGRQRRTALTSMFDDPEVIYNWASKYCRLKKEDSGQLAVQKVYEAIVEYIEADSDVTRTSSDASYFEAGSAFEGGETEDVPFDENNSKYGDGIKVLLRLIKCAHERKSRNGTGLTTVFDFRSFFQRLNYVNQNGNYCSFDSKKIKRLINEYVHSCKDDRKDFENADCFITYMTERFALIDENKFNAFKTMVEQTWDDIKAVMKVYIDVAQVISDAEVGIIQISGITEQDQQKIFDLINSKGTKLTPAEVLSAKPMWNKMIDHPSAVLSSETQWLYNFIEIETDHIVKWDVPATFVRRFKDSPYRLFFSSFSETELSVFEKNVGLGFKLLAGIFENGVRQDDISKLSKRTDINWENDIEIIADELQQMFKVIYEFNYFKYLETWNKNMMSMLSDGPIINFILYMYKYWKTIGKPTTVSGNVINFQKNAFIYFDRMVYEYLLDQWKGSSDAKILKNLENVPTSKVDFEPVEQTKWQAMLTDLIDNCKLADSLVENHSKLTPILYHAYALHLIKGPNILGATLDIDHIMPQNLWTNSRVPNKEYLVNNLCNLALLPKKDNISKSDKKLSEISDPWLKDQIKDYEGIEETRYADFSDILKYQELFDFRKPFFVDAFGSKRDSLLNN